MTATARGVLGTVLAAFAALNVYVIAASGLGGLDVLIERANAWTVLLAVDLAISLGLVCTWVVADARERGVSPVPYVLLTVATGSIGPLLYLLFGRRAPRPA